MLRATQTKAIDQIIPLSRLGKMQTSDITERNKSTKETQIVAAQVGDSMVKYL